MNIIKKIIKNKKDVLPVNGNSCQQRTSNTSSTSEAENAVNVDATTYGRVSTSSRSKNGTKLHKVHKKAFPKS